MTTFKPFPGIFYSETAGKCKDLVCPAYDVISEKERESFLQKSPYNFVRLEAPQGENAYEQANQLLTEWLEQGLLEQDSSPAFYLYEAAYTVSDEVYRLRGILGLLRLPEENSTVLTHENTFENAKKDRLALLQATKANTSPIYSIYDDPKGELWQALAPIFETEPVRSCQVRDITHKLWALKEESLIQKATDFLTDQPLYIADGHHRYQTALNYRASLAQQGELSPEHPANYVFTLLCERHCPGLVVLPTHRVLKDIPCFDSDEIYQAAKDYFELIPCHNLTYGRNRLFEFRRQNKNAFLFYADEEYRLFVLKDSVSPRSLIPSLSEHSDAFCRLDVVVLHEILFSKVMNLSDEQITYTRSGKEACSLVDSGDACAAVLLSATRIDELCAVAKAGENMPQKSTYFYPKPISGLVFRK